MEEDENIEEENEVKDNRTEINHFNPKVISSATNLFCRLASIIEDDTDKKIDGFKKSIVDSKERKRLMKKKQSMGMKMG